MTKMRACSVNERVLLIPWTLSALRHSDGSLKEGRTLIVAFIRIKALLPDKGIRTSLDQTWPQPGHLEALDPRKALELVLPEIVARA